MLLFLSSEVQHLRTGALPLIILTQHTHFTWHTHYTLRLHRHTHCFTICSCSTHSFFDNNTHSEIPFSTHFCQHAHSGITALILSELPRLRVEPWEAESCCESGWGYLIRGRRNQHENWSRWAELCDTGRRPPSEKTESSRGISFWAQTAGAESENTEPGERGGGETVWPPEEVRTHAHIYTLQYKHTHLHRQAYMVIHTPGRELSFRDLLVQWGLLDLTIVTSWSRCFRFRLNLHGPLSSKSAC